MSLRANKELKCIYAPRMWRAGLSVNNKKIYIFQKNITKISPKKSELF